MSENYNNQKTLQKSGNKNLIVTIILIIITALVAAGATWYYMDSKQKDQQSNNQKQVDKLEVRVTDLENNLFKKLDHIQKDIQDIKVAFARSENNHKS